MKKIVFLFCFVFLSVPLETEASDVFSCDGNALEINYSDSNIIITKRGTSPFLKQYNVEGYTIHIANMICVDNQYILYGYAHNINGSTYYDSYLMVLNSKGDILYQEIEDYELEEEIMSVQYVNQVYFKLTKFDYENDRELFFDHITITTYDTNFNKIDEIELDQEVKKIETTDELLLLSYTTYAKYDIGFDTVFNEYKSTDIFDIKNEYTGNVTLPFINKGLLNDEVIENGLDINYPGVYKFEYNNQEYHFIVHPLVEGVEHMVTYDDSVTPVFSSGNATLNGESFISGTKVDTPGYYNLTITGISQYQKSIEFSISPKVEGVINGHSYSKPIQVRFEGEGYLNNNLVTSPITIDQDGDYVLRIMGVNGYSDIFEFSYYEESSQITIKDIVSNIDIFVFIIVVVGGIWIIKKK